MRCAYYSIRSFFLGARAELKKAEQVMLECGSSCEKYTGAIFEIDLGEYVEMELHENSSEVRRFLERVKTEEAAEYLVMIFYKLDGHAFHLTKKNGVIYHNSPELFSENIDAREYSRFFGKYTIDDFGDFRDLFYGNIGILVVKKREGFYEQ